jgi:hypothetical protein
LRESNYSNQEQIMIFLLLAAFSFGCVWVYRVAARRAARPTRASYLAAPRGRSVIMPNRHAPARAVGESTRWTALDDRQLERLLDRSGD